MKPVVRYSRLKIHIAMTGLLLLMISIFLIVSPKVHAGGDWGDTGLSSGGSSSGGYWTSHGFGWKLFDVNSNGPNGGFKIGSWSDISGRCSAVGDNKVWVHVVRNSGGSEKSFTYQGYDYPYDHSRNRPSSGLDPYVYNSSGSYENQGAAYQQKVIDIVAVIKGYYLKANPTGSGWGVSVGWFCWSNNPPWDVSVTSDVDRKTIEPDETVTWTHTIINNGPSKTNKNISWQYQNGGDWQNTLGSNWVFPSGSVAGKNGTNVKTSTYTAMASDIGKKICRITVASPKSNTSTSSIESDSKCVLVVKKPKVQIWGGDLTAGVVVGTGMPPKSGEVTTSTSIKAIDGKSRTFGSWVEYGIFAAGSINGTASGSMFAGDDGLQDATVCGYSTLSFTNSKPKTCSNDNVKIGSYYVSQPAPSVSANFSQKGSTISQNRLNPNSLLLSRGVYIGTRDGNLVIDGGVLSNGKSIILKVSGTVTIAGNLTNSFNNGGANYRNIHELSQLVIIANKIIINSNVVNVDAWLVADGKDGIIETCDTGSSTFDLTGVSRLTVNKCNNKLTINGPVMAKHLWLRRTAGSGAGKSSGDPAEVFNLRADAYLWAAARSVNLGRAQTVYSTELPPRF